MEKKELIIKILEELKVKESMIDHLNKTFNLTNEILDEESNKEKEQAKKLFEGNFSELIDIYVTCYEKNYNKEELEKTLELLSSLEFKETTAKTKEIEAELQEPMMNWLQKTFSSLFN